MKSLLFIHLILFLILSLKAQTFKKIRASEQDKKIGIWETYTSTSFEYFAKITLFNNASFRYEENSANSSVFSHGKWVRRNNVLILNSFIDSADVPVKIYYLNHKIARIYYVRLKSDKNIITYYKTEFEVPINLKKSPFPDSRIFVNNDSSYCFPFLTHVLEDQIKSMNKN